MVCQDTSSYSNALLVLCIYLYFYKRYPIFPVLISARSSIDGEDVGVLVYGSIYGMEEEMAENFEWLMGTSKADFVRYYQLQIFAEIVGEKFLNAPYFITS
ncbi:hypothetical protein HHI36_022520 [Cryptolaemus montrouzieri]|uniref:Uncharacterized protein n=1 Tax=Cryptolaemus montrouzieri TaxID=559131 RepID=A0ABD2MZX0_9CUCU